jgi:hypothetical protein
MHTNDHFLLPRCTGMNCGATDANHSPECRAEHAAAIAGGRFVKDEKRAADDAERDALVIAEAALADIGDAEREPGDDLAWCERRAAQALPAVRAALSARADGGKGDEHDSRMWDAGYSAGIDFERRRNAPQAECAPREAQPVAKIDADGDFVWLVHNPKFAEGTEFYASPTPERADAEKDAALTDEQIVENWLTKMGLWDSAFVCQDQKDTLAAFCSYARAILAAIKNKEKKS